MLLVGIPTVDATAEATLATVFNPENGHRKQIVVGDPNAFLGGYLLEVAQVKTVPEDVLGFSVITDYSKNLSSSMSSSQSTIPVTSVTTKDGHVLTMGDLGSKVFLVIEPGKRKEEIVMCTGISGTTWTGCTRGLAFYGTSTASVSANRKTHSASSQVIISNTHYVYDELVDKDSTETIGGDKTFTGTITTKNIVATGTTVTFNNAIVSASATYATADNQLITLAQANSIGNQGAATSTYTSSGISERATKAEIAAGTSFSASNPHYMSSEHATSTGGYATTSVVVTEPTGTIDNDFVDRSEDLTFSGSNTYSGTSTFSGNVLCSTMFCGDGSDGALVATTTTTIEAGGAEVVIMNYTSITIATGTTLQLNNKSASGTILILKSKGNVTIGGTIDLDGDGADVGLNGYGLLGTTAKYGVAGTVGAIYTDKDDYITPDANRLYRRVIYIGAGSSGGNGTAGAGSGGAGGAGGKGGGALIIHVGNAFNFQTGAIIDVSGATGSNGADSGAGVAGGGGGGGGAGAAGMALVLYNNLTANSGVINAKGGTGGTGGTGGNLASSDAGGIGGAGAGSWSFAGAEDGAGGTGGGGAGGAGTASSGANGAGGGGGGGDVSGAGGAGGAAGTTDANHYLVTKNTEF